MSREKLFITGGTGFLGTHLARMLGDKYEIILGGSPHEQKTEHIIPLDVANPDEVRQVIAKTEPHGVINAAAIKSLVEADQHPVRCIDVNINGSKHIALAAQEYGVGFVLGISSNKVALPTSLYSHSKAVMERMFANLNGPNTHFASIRLGNLLWAPGSFLTKWHEMTHNEGIVRSTGVDATRFLQTVEYACGLIKGMLNNREEVEGSIITPDLKAARLQDVLDIWVEAKDCQYEAVESRSVDVPKDVLISEAEFAHTERHHIEGYHCFRTTPGKKPAYHLVEAVDSENTALHDRGELRQMIGLL